MMKKCLLWVALALCLGTVGRAQTFSAGADVSWTTEIESRGYTYANRQGEPRECMALMRELGFSAVRLRVWVHPTAGYNGKDDVVAKAQRAQAEGLDVMLDFHYSDTWADPGSQLKPAAWRGKDQAALVDSIKAHTRDVLGALKAEGISVAWVQVGNEVRSGLLWDTDTATSGATWDAEKGSTTYKTNTANFAAFLNAGSQAVREVYPEAKVIVHCDKGEDWGSLNWIAELVKAVDYDIFGVSLYPTEAWQANVAACVANLRQLHSTWHKETMVCEVGMPVSPATTARDALAELYAQCAALPSCRGVFYWEPEAYAGWSGYQMGASTLSGKVITPTVALDAIAPYATSLVAPPAPRPAALPAFDLEGRRVAGQPVGICVRDGRTVVVR